MSLLVQQFLETHSLKELQEQHGVYASFSKSGHKFSLNYDQIEARESDPLSQECRGLILAAEDGKSFLSQAVMLNGKLSYENVIIGKTKILAFPMKRFFNYGQGCAAEVNWADPNLAVLEKLDGTLCIVYYDPFIDKWCVATRSVPEADLFMDNGIFTFRTLFEKAFEETTGYSFEKIFNNPGSSYRDFTYCFELTTVYNRIVVNYSNNRVTLLSVRDNFLLEELDPREAMKRSLVPNVPVVQAHTYKSVSELVEWVSSLNPMDHEGVVIRDSNFNRLKVKNAAYVAYNRVRDTLGTSERNCLEIVLQEKDDDVTPFLPDEIVKNLLKIKSGLQKFIKEYDQKYLEIKSQANAILPGDKKTFAILLTKNKELWTPPFFVIFEGKVNNVKEFILHNRKDGTWGNSFLDKLLELSKKFEGQ